MAALGVPNGVCAGGALHHTGDITRAITDVADRVATGAVLAIAIYIRDITSPLEWEIKCFCNRAPAWVLLATAAILVPIIFQAKLTGTWNNSLRQIGFGISDTTYHSKC